MRGSRYQYGLIALGVFATLLFCYFFYKEIFPEYKIYQDDYVELEKFRSTYTGEPIPPFRTGIKQIVIEKEDKGNPTIDRCTTCHVALQLPHFSPTKIAKDINGNTVLDDDGLPVQEPNDEYIWSRLDLEIKKLRDEGNNRLADKYENLKIAKVGNVEYDVRKVLVAHPLMGRETVPFQYHPIDEYGCVSCHNGNGRGLVTDRAHGPVFDEAYETEYRGFVPQFLEKDEKNDPKFARVFNDKPGHRLLFQTSPIYVGALIQAKCVQCHLTSKETLDSAIQSALSVKGVREKQIQSLQKGFEVDKNALISLANLKSDLLKNGYEKTLAIYKERSNNYSLPASDQFSSQNQYEFLKKHPKDALELINKQISALVGNINIDSLNAESFDDFIKDQKGERTGALFQKKVQLDFEKALIAHIQDVNQGQFDPADIGKIQTDVDLLTKDFQKGKELFISQACYACHRIAGYTRGGVGPELTKEGNSYPWFVKESIVWPQADLKTSTMPNQKLDHEEIEALVTFLLAQKGERKAQSGQAYKTMVMNWESGKKQPWEEPIAASNIQNLDYSMTVFATEGCASCHRLKGFQSEYGFVVEKEKKPDFEQLLKQQDWFKSNFPEDILGSELAARIDKLGPEIDRRIAKVRDPALIERIEKEHPGLIESFYTSFKFANRAKNHEVRDEKFKLYQERLHKVLMIFVQEYGLGRLIGPRPNWAGVYRSDEWLMEHFKAPTAHIPRSIMPVMPFDETKFYSLTYMLDVLGQQNRDQVRKIWEVRGFKPDIAYEIFCAQCHGPFMQGDGPVAEWIYPIPKNLRKADFLRNLTKEQAIFSLTHGVKGTPMPPWGEIGSDKVHKNFPVLSAEEIQKLTDWLYTNLPGGETIRSSDEVPKWQYSPKDVLEDLKREGGKLERKKDLSAYFPQAKGLIASTAPTQTLESDNIFDATPNPYNSKENFYYIKREYYTPENIARGQAFFVTNCAVCHGKEGDGAGVRAEAMFDAKPRMFINLDWINFRDDLRLLRSIKFGVPGTSMVPWGDQTSALQRMQLVIFIRSLTDAANNRKSLFEGIYGAFDVPDVAIENSRSELVSLIEQKQDELDKARLSQSQLEKSDPSKALEEYKKVLSLQQELDNLRARNKIMIELKSSLKKEREAYLSLGSQILLLPDANQYLPEYVKILKLNDDKIQLDNSHLKFLPNEKVNTYLKRFLDNLKSSIDTHEKMLDLEKEKMNSASKTQDIKILEQQISALKRLEKTAETNITLFNQLNEEQQRAIEKWNQNDK